MQIFQRIMFIGGERDKERRVDASKNVTIWYSMSINFKLKEKKTNCQCGWNREFQSHVKIFCSWEFRNVYIELLIWCQYVDSFMQIDNAANFNGVHLFSVNYWWNIKLRWYSATHNVLYFIRTMYSKHQINADS